MREQIQEVLTKKFIFKLLRQEITTKHLTQKKLWKKMAQQMIDFQKLSSIQIQRSLDKALENGELKNFLNQMNRELVVPENQSDPDFFKDYDDVQPKKIKYSSTKVETKNLLTNVSYRRKFINKRILQTI